MKFDRVRISDSSLRFTTQAAGEFIPSAAKLVGGNSGTKRSADALGAGFAVEGPAPLH